MALFASELEVSSFDGGCVVTMPMKTVDDRYVTVWVERVPGSNFVYVHDGGKNTSELFAQGIHSTPGQESVLKGIAHRHGAYFQDGRFQIACPNHHEEMIRAAVLSIAQCASLAMIDVVSHEAKVEDEPLSGRVGRLLEEWKPPYVEIRRREVVVGTTGAEHLFDFVSRPRTRAAKTVAIKLLPPSVGPPWQVARYGFLALDIKNHDAARWPRLAIISKAEDWSPRHIETIASLSDDTIVLSSDHEERLAELLPDKMTKLTKAA